MSITALKSLKHVIIQYNGKMIPKWGFMIYCDIFPEDSCFQYRMINEWLAMGAPTSLVLSIKVYATY
jgi:hypothetical protein